MQRLYTIALVIGIGLPVLIYSKAMGLNPIPLHLPMGESGMITMSYIWFPALVFGLIGKILKKISTKKAVLITVAALILQVVFFAGIWPAL